MEKWQKKWMAQHPEAFLQEFSSEHFQQTMQTSAALSAGQIVPPTAVSLVASAI